MRLKSVKFHEAVEVDRKNSTYYQDEGPGQVNRVRLWYYPTKQVVCVQSEKSEEVLLIPMHGNVETMKPMSFDPEEWDVNRGRPPKAGNA